MFIESEPANTLAIDVHGHYGTCQVSGMSPLTSRFCSGDTEVVIRRASIARTVCTIVSPLSGLHPRGAADAISANEQAHRDVIRQPGLMQWVIVNPRQPDTFRQAEVMLQHPKCAGIKIHPEMHDYPIREYGGDLFELAAKQRAVVLAHSGDELSWPEEFVPFADAIPEVRLILAHLGNGGRASGTPDLQVRAVQSCRHGNIWIDTSSARSLLPGLIEWAVDEVGAERILYGTDTPLYFAPSQRARIDGAEISDHDKLCILSGNATRLLGLADDLQSRGLDRTQKEW